MTHALTSKGGRHLFFRRKTILVFNGQVIKFKTNKCLIVRYSTEQISLNYITMMIKPLYASGFLYWFDTMNLGWSIVCI